MEPIDLIAYLEKPERLCGEAVPAMERLATSYPYFSITQCLLAIAYQNENDDRYQTQLGKAADSIANRNNLRLLSKLAKSRWEKQSQPKAETGRLEEPAPETSFFKFVASTAVQENEMDGPVIPEKMFIIPEID